MNPPTHYFSYVIKVWPLKLNWFEIQYLCLFDRIILIDSKIVLTNLATMVLVANRWINIINKKNGDENLLLWDVSFANCKLFEFEHQHIYFAFFSTVPWNAQRLLSLVKVILEFLSVDSIFYQESRICS